jgi:hypothetical protein
MRWRTYLTQSFLTLSLVASTLVDATAQQRLEDGKNAFDARRLPTRELRNQLFRGDVQPDLKNKDHVEAIEYSAKEVTYPLVWMTQERPPAGEIIKIVDLFERNLSDLSRNRSTTAAFHHIYMKQTIESALEVGQKGKPIAAVNVARMLSRIPARRLDRQFPIAEKEWIDEVTPRLAEGVGDQYANACITLLDDTKCTDGARYYLFMGLADLLALPRTPSSFVKPATEEKIYAAAAKIIEKKVPFPKATPRAEVEGYKVMRLQAVKVLAQAAAPTVGKQRPGLWLGRVAGNDESIVPAARLEERTEAAMGLARMGASSPKFPNFSMEYATTQIARATVEFGLQAHPNRESKAVVRTRPWKVDAARLIETLEPLQAQVKTPYVQDATKLALAVVNSVERGNDSRANDLNDWLSKNDPPTQLLYRDDPSSAVKPHPVVTEEEAPKEEEKPKEKEKEKPKDKGKEAPPAKDKDKGKTDTKTKDKGK